jgi:hypothetical protein
MFKAVSPRTLVAAWAAVFVAIAVTAVASGVAITVSISALWLAACVVPPAVMLMVWRGAPPPTIAEVLYAVHRRD